MSILAGTAQVSVLGQESAKSKSFALTDLEIVRIVCTRAGYKDVDVQPDPTGTFIKASLGPKGSVSVKGSSLADACRKMVETVW